MIKQHGCLYGGIVVIRDDPELYQSMERIQNTYKVYSRKDLMIRALKAIAILNFGNKKGGARIMSMIGEY